MQKRLATCRVSSHGKKQTPLEMPAQRLQAWLRPMFVHTDTPPTRKSGTDVPVHIIHAASCEHIPVCAHGEKNYINENRWIQLFCLRLLSCRPSVRITLGSPIKTSTYEYEAHKCFCFSTRISTLLSQKRNCHRYVFQRHYSA
jgi:hypothetical protein